ncbi:MAG: RDD family protein [Planctomycetota bacterium]
MSSKLRRALIGEGSAPSTLEGVLGPPPVATREIPTPEGVTLTFEIASGGDRASGFLIDLVLIGLLLLGCGFLASQLLPFSSFLIFLQLAFFGLRCFYFTGFELLLRGRTPGKLLTGTQVIDRQGGPLRVEAIFARNLTREFEHFIPFIVLINGGAILPDAPTWSAWFAFVWAGVFGLFPLLNPERLRLGDILAGTMVVKAPRPILADDLGAEAPTEDSAEARGEEIASAPRVHSFRREQLERYGIYELQVLEEVLRQQKMRRKTLIGIRDRIQRKIGYEQRGGDPRVFLEEFYRAQRIFLEERLLLGEKREDKHAADDAQPSREGRGSTDEGDARS